MDSYIILFFAQIVLFIAIEAFHNRTCWEKSKRDFFTSISLRLPACSLFWYVVALRARIKHFAVICLFGFFVRCSHLLPFPLQFNFPQLADFSIFNVFFQPQLCVYLDDMRQYKAQTKINQLLILYSFLAVQTCRNSYSAFYIWINQIKITPMHFINHIRKVVYQVSTLSILISLTDIRKYTYIQFIQMDFGEIDTISIYFC